MLKIEEDYSINLVKIIYYSEINIVKFSNNNIFLFFSIKTLYNALSKYNIKYINNLKI